MGKMEFKMERQGLLNIGDVLPIQEFDLPNSYYYVLGHAYAMTGNYSLVERISATEGTVVSIDKTPKGYFVTVEYED